MKLTGEEPGIPFEMRSTQSQLGLMGRGDELWWAEVLPTFA